MFKSFATSLTIVLVLLLTMGGAFSAVVSQSDYDMLKTKLAAEESLSQSDINMIFELHSAGTPIVDDWELGQLKEYGSIGDRPVQNRRPGNTLDEYIYSTTTYDWFDISGMGDEHLLTDDGGAPITIPFSFPFYDGSYTAIMIASNGFIEVGGTGTYGSLSNTALPTAATPNNIIAMFWDDLDSDEGTHGHIYSYHDVAHDRFVVQFQEVEAYPSGNPETFQCFMYTNGNIIIQWQTVSDASSCTVGIENADGTEGVQVCYNTEGVDCPANGTAVIINQPDGVPLPVTNLTSVQVVADVNLSWTDPSQDTNGNAITPDNIQVWLGEPDVGTLLGTVGAGVQSYTHLNAPSGSLTYYVRAFLDPYYSAPATTNIVVGNPSYDEDFDVSNGQWVQTTGAVWEWGAPTWADGPTAHSDPNVWGSYLAGDYVDPLLDAHLDLDIGLTINTAAASIEFWAWWEMENGFDGCNMKISVDGGTTWEILTPDGDYPDDEISLNFGSPIAGEPAWTGTTSPAWTFVNISLAAYVGQAPILRFHFASDESIQGYAGFYFDDMIIWGLAEPVGADISGTISLDGGAGDITAVTVHADGIGNPQTNPAGDGSYTLEDALVGMRNVWAELTGYHTASTTVDLPEGGVTGVDLTLVREDPPVPTGLDASVNNTTGIVTLTWDVSADPLVDSYNIFRKLQEDEEFVNVGNATATTYDDDLNGPGPGIYQYAITAIDADVSTPVESEMSDPVTALYGELPPSGLSANGNFDDKIVLDWFVPGTPPEFELSYDDGTNEIGGLGFWNGSPTFGWMVSKFQTTGGPITVNKVKLFITTTGLDGDVFEIGVFADNGGVPTFTPLGVTSITQQAPFDAWFEWDLDSPVTLGDGIAWVGHRQITAFQGVSVGGDDNNPYINNTFKYSYDQTEWTSFEPDLMTIPMQRCFAIGAFGAIVELMPAPVDVERMPATKSETKNGKPIMTVEIPENWMTTGPDYRYNFNALAALAAEAVAPHAPFVRPVDNRSHGNSLDDVVYYIVYRDDTDIGHPTTEHYEDTGLEENIQYSYFVTAFYDNDAESGPTETVTAACNMAPAAPTSLAGNASGNTQMLLTWVDPIANADGTALVDLEGIQVFRDGGLIATVAAGEQQYIDTPPVADQFYTWTVSAIDEVPNVSDPSNGHVGAVVSPWATVDYEWIDISGMGTPLDMGDDDGQGPFDMGFSVNFMGGSYSSVNVISNGFASFTGTDAPYTNGSIPTPDIPNGGLYVFWDDFNPTAGGQVYYYADAANDRFIISWDDVPPYGGTDLYKFQIVINVGDAIRYNYHTIPDNTSCTVGVENEAGDDAIQVCFNGEGWLPESGTSIEFWGGPSGEIAGQVRRVGTNAPIEGAEITVAEVPGALALSNAAGEYTLEVEPGTYTVQVHKQGYCDIEDPGVIVEDNNTTTRFYTMSFPDGSASVTSVNLYTQVDVDVSDVFDLVNSSNATCEFVYSISTDAPWLSFTPDEGEVAMNSSSTISVDATVDGMSTGTYNATITIENNGETSPIEIPVVLEIGVAVDDPGFIPTDFAFYQNYPNPFNATTALQFDLPVEAAVEIMVFNVMGQEVDRPVSATYPAGRYKVMYTADALPSGMYLVKMTAGSYSGLHKMVLLK